MPKRQTQPDLPILDYISATEAYIKDLNVDEVNAALIRNTVITHTEKMKVKQSYKPTRSNLSPDKWKALKSLQNDHLIMIIPADKGNKTVILDRDLYLEKLENRTVNHHPVNAEPAIKYKRLLNNMLTDMSCIMLSFSSI